MATAAPLQAGVRQQTLRRITGFEVIVGLARVKVVETVFVDVRALKAVRLPLKSRVEMRFIVQGAAQRHFANLAA